MKLFSNMQICGDCRPHVERRDGHIWVTVKDGNQSITMEAKHVRALWQALALFETREWKADHPDALIPDAEAV